MLTRLVVGVSLFLSLVVVGLLIILLIIEHRSPLRYEQGRWNYFSVLRYGQEYPDALSQEAYERKLRNALEQWDGPLAFSAVSALGPDSHSCDDLDLGFKFVDAFAGIEKFSKSVSIRLDGTGSVRCRYDVYCDDGKIVGRALDMFSETFYAEAVAERFDLVLTSIIQYYEDAFGYEMESSVIKDTIDFGVIDVVHRTDKLKWVADGRAVKVMLHMSFNGRDMSLALYDYSKEISVRFLLWDH